MAFYAIAGEGPGNKTEILKSLGDLKDKAAEDDVEFWFGVLAKDDPTATDKAIMDWLRKEEIWFEVIGADDGTVYAGAQEYHDVKVPNQKVIGLLNKAKDDNEDSSLLALFVDSEGDSPDDGELMTLVEKVVDAEFPIFLLNGQMQELSLEADGGEEAAEEPEEDAAAEEDEAAPTVFTREELMKMQVPELTGLAKGQGIDTKGLGKRDLVAALLGETEAEEPAKPTKAASKKAAAKPKAAVLAESEEDVERFASEGVESVLSNGQALVVVIYDGRVMTAMMSGAKAMAMII